MIEFLYSVPMSEMNVFIGPYLNIKDSKIVFATVLALLLAIGMATKYFVRSHISVTAYSLPLSDFGSVPIVPTITLSKAIIGMSVIGCVVQVPARETHGFFRLLGYKGSSPRSANKLTSAQQADCEHATYPSWHFSVPYSPISEASVKSIKHHLQRIVGNHKQTYEELATVLIRTQACLNYRLLCPVTADPIFSSATPFSTMRNVALKTRRSVSNFCLIKI